MCYVTWLCNYIRWRVHIYYHWFFTIQLQYLHTCSVLNVSSMQSYLYESIILLLNRCCPCLLSMPRNSEYVQLSRNCNVVPWGLHIHARVFSLTVKTGLFMHGCCARDQGDFYKLLSWIYIAVRSRCWVNNGHNLVLQIADRTRCVYRVGYDLENSHCQWRTNK